jgi:heme-binding protein
VASIKQRSRRDFSSYWDVIFRFDGRQRSVSFQTEEHANKFRDLATAMRMSARAARRVRYAVVAACSLVVAAGIAMPTAEAAPCSASGLATTASGVLGAAGGYLANHPGANDVLTAAATQSPEDAKSAVRAYFVAHPNEYLDLQGIAGPLKNMQNQCGVSVTPAQLALLFEQVSN